jgi:hypothetical protein
VGRGFPADIDALQKQVAAEGVVALLEGDAEGWHKLHAALLDDSCSGAEYADALEWACSEHIAQTRETQQQLLPFAYGVAFAMPIELICWLRYRRGRGRGLEHATHGHPLLETALATLDPPPPPPTQAPLRLTQLVELALPHLRACLTDA